MDERKEFKLEYIIKSSPNILFKYLSTPSGISEWFCDNVNIKDDIFNFYWDGSEDAAKMLEKKDKKLIRFQWLDDEGSDYYFEFELKKDALTNETALIITDFAEDDEKEEAVLLWDSQVDDLKHILGS
ncbi:START-like domain-containing protein [Salibacter sp.]|uniref:START-like domain-containing protein n=1 Tax=Salibacter sp. TaxID=2010995 RepID=UPI00287039CE|nr:START-like domain-containing protein [Salibacter sp.]MDR9398738.1 START-like domain-containing protein [Salibacter sp.]MDR9486537.1 START-like domain-containing protein [Salibacter sp.]